MTNEEKKHVISFVIEYEMYTDVPASAVSASDEVIAYFNPDDPSNDTTGDDITGNDPSDDTTGDSPSDDTTGDDITGDNTTGDDS